jgi:hypothetical protein
VQIGLDSNADSLGTTFTLGHAIDVGRVESQTLGNACKKVPFVSYRRGVVSLIVSFAQITKFKHGCLCNIAHFLNRLN